MDPLVSTLAKESGEVRAAKRNRAAFTSNASIHLHLTIKRENNSNNVANPPSPRAHLGALCSASDRPTTSPPPPPLHHFHAPPSILARTQPLLPLPATTHLTIRR